jgi:hypothetical protein
MDKRLAVLLTLLTVACAGRQHRHDFACEPTSIDVTNDLADPVEIRYGGTLERDELLGVVEPNSRRSFEVPRGGVPGIYPTIRVAGQKVMLNSTEKPAVRITPVCP